MKKILIPFIAVIALSCGKKNPLNPMGDCTGLSEAYLSAASAYTSNPSKQSCEAFINSLDELVNKCAILTAEQKRDYREQRGELVCE